MVAAGGGAPVWHQDIYNYLDDTGGWLSGVSQHNTLANGGRLIQIRFIERGVIDLRNGYHLIIFILKIDGSQQKSSHKLWICTGDSSVLLPTRFMHLFCIDLSIICLINSDWLCVLENEWIHPGTSKLILLDHSINQQLLVLVHTRLLCMSGHNCLMLETEYSSLFMLLEWNAC